MTALRMIGILAAGGIAAIPLAIAGCGSPPGATNAPTGAPLSAAPGPTLGGTGAGQVPTGTWTMTVTPGDLEAAGFPGEAAAAENAGDFSLTIAPDGTWTMAQASSQPVRWPVFRGTYTPTGENTMEMRTTFPPDYAGDVVSVRLTEGAEGLAIKLLSPDDPLLRFQLEGHVWAPSR